MWSRDINKNSSRGSDRCRFCTHTQQNTSMLVSPKLVELHGTLQNGAPLRREGQLVAAARRQGGGTLYK